MKNIVMLGLMAIVFIMSSCERFLDVKSDQTLAVITSVKDLQALLDYYPVMNDVEPSSPEISADNYFISFTDYNAMSNEGHRRMYIWAKDNFYPSYPNEWSYTYRVVYSANTVITKAEEIEILPHEQLAVKNALGQAYCHRARAFFNLSQIFTLPYDPATANTDLGIPLRLDPDFNVASKRSTVEETYQQIISDLKKAIRLLPDAQPTLLRPTKPAAYGWLSRVYLSMNKFTEAKLYADSCLAYNFSFINFNTLNASAAYPIPRFNSEVVNDNNLGAAQPIYAATISRIVPELYNQYTANDLRKTVFFRAVTGGTYAFKGSYLGTFSLFGGIAIDEVYLTRAECLIRAGDVANGLKDLNALLVNRFKTGTYVPYSGLSQAEALALVLTERRKELLMRCLRWIDIRRLNKLGANITLKRELNGVTYTLEPNSNRYALPLPESVLVLSGMPQNPR